MNGTKYFFSGLYASLIGIAVWLAMLVCSPAITKSLIQVQASLSPTQAYLLPLVVVLGILLLSFLWSLIFFHRLRILLLSHIQGATNEYPLTLRYTTSSACASRILKPNVLGFPFAKAYAILLVSYGVWGFVWKGYDLDLFAYPYFMQYWMLAYVILLTCARCVRLKSLIAAVSETPRTDVVIRLERTKGFIELYASSATPRRICVISVEDVMRYSWLPHATTASNSVTTTT